MFTVLGLNYKTAHLNMREAFAQFAICPSHQRQFSELPGVNEALWLSTCNRTEIYCDTNDTSAILPWIATQLSMAVDDIAPYCYILQGDEALLHTLRVTIGLDSMMVGEPQILGQMKQAYQQAIKSHTVQRVLHQTFQYIFNASKRIRHTSGIGRHPVSIAFAAARLIQQSFKKMASLRVLVIGSGETASLVTKYLSQQHVKEFMFASRTHQNANKLAVEFSGEAFDITELPAYLSKADVVISATACPLPFISAHLVSYAMSCRQQQPMFFLDLAVPRDIEVNVGQLPHVTLYNIDDLHQMVQKNIHHRNAAATHAEELVLQELTSYQQWQRSLQAADTIREYRDQIKILAAHELNRAKQKLANGHCQYDVLQEFSERLVNKLIHTPTIRLREAAIEQREDWLDMAQYFIHTSESSYEKIS